MNDPQKMVQRGNYTAQRRTDNSAALFARAKAVIPGGVNSPVRAYRAVGGTPPFIVRGEGDTVYDADGNAYTDYVMSWGPLVLGHARREVVVAVQAAAVRGTSFGAPTAAEVELAEELRAACPHMELVRLVNSGTEATMSAIRAARGFTGCDLVVKFAGCYHGHSDGLLVKAGSGCLTGASPDSAGVPAAYASCTLVAEYNSAESVSRLFAANPNKIACVIVEPVAANMGVVPPQGNFLRELRRLCDENGALLIFDEVITGFRVARGGAAALYNVRPDLAAYGKIVGGGLPLAAYGGRRDVMEFVAPLGPVYQAGTLSGNPVAAAADFQPGRRGNPAASAGGWAALRILREKGAEIYPALEEKGAYLEKAFAEAGVPCGRVGSVLAPFFAERAPQNFAETVKCDTKKFAAYFRAMLDAGEYVAPSQFEGMFVSFAHAREHLERTREHILAAAEAAQRG